MVSWVRCGTLLNCFLIFASFLTLKVARFAPVALLRYNWLVDNKLSLHMGKSECNIFGSKRKLRKINNFSVECYGRTI